MSAPNTPTHSSPNEGRQESDADPRTDGRPQTYTNLLTGETSTLGGLIANISDRARGRNEPEEEEQSDPEEEEQSDPEEEEQSDPEEEEDSGSEEEGALGPEDEEDSGPEEPEEQTQLEESTGAEQPVEPAEAEVSTAQQQLAALQQLATPTELERSLTDGRQVLFNIVWWGRLETLRTTELPADDRNCPICTLEFHDPHLAPRSVNGPACRTCLPHRFLECGHIIGGECLNVWTINNLAAGRDITCPMCRTVLYRYRQWHPDPLSWGMPG